MRGLAGRIALLAVAAVAARSGRAHAQPDLGHKIPGAVGLDAGTQPDPGIYFGDRFLYWDAVALRDRDGSRVAVPGLDIDAFANGLGVASSLRVEPGLHLGAAVAVPVARVSASSNDPRTSVDRFGLGDVFVKPIQLGGRFRRLDVVTSYGFYAPTQQLHREGLRAPQWAHQFSFGGALFFDRLRRARISLLAGYDLHHRKLGIDVTRGDSVQIQGGIGSVVFGFLDVGMAGYALWQVRDDRGADLPAALRGRRERVFGLGPEVNVPLPPLRAKLGLRYVRDFGVQGRPQGQVVVVSLSFLLWRNRGHTSAAQRSSLRRGRGGRGSVSACFLGVAASRC